MAKELTLEPGGNCWRIARADRAALIVDAADYFRIVRGAMLAARSQIMLIGWDFDTRVSLDPDCDDGAPAELGALLSWIARERPELEIRILKWDVGAIKLLGRGTTMLRLARWMAHPRITFKLDGSHPVGASHHHKIAVIDDCLAFCGGIDMTAGRWDTREHRDDDARRRRPTTGRLADPWHDSTMAVSGEAARWLGEHARQRWRAAGGDAVAAPPVRRDLWPERLEPDFREVRVAIARTRAAFDGESSVREIEHLFVDMIESARHFFYAESQYFASRALAAAIARRLDQPDGPEFVLVQPKAAEGWLEEQAMGAARARLLGALREADRHGRLRVYTPVTEAGQDIYVHAKIAVVDDVMLRVGSANMNNRSMGLDSECDLLIDGRAPADEAVRERIREIRAGLVAEHLGVDPADVERKRSETRSLIAAIESLRRDGRSLRPLDLDAKNRLQTMVAESELLDPEGAAADFEPMARPGLLAGLGRSLPWKRHRKQSAR